MAININLYPPIVETYTPGFLVDSTDEAKNVCKVFFKLSPYNSLESIKNAQVTVRNQYNNLSMLDEGKYPNEIMLTTVKEDATRKTDDKYYIEIKKTDMKGNTFELNQYYKVQIRFTSTKATDISMATPQAMGQWLHDNLNLFSEWSSVCLVRGISTPQLFISGLETSGGVIPWSMSSTTILGKLEFVDSSESDYLSSYQIKLYDSTRKILTNSGTLYVNNYEDVNSFKYPLSYNFNVDSSYILSIKVTTGTFYTEEKEYNFRVTSDSLKPLDLALSIDPEEDNGRIKLTVKKSNLLTPFEGSVVIRRASSETNFNIWEDIYFQDCNGSTSIKIETYDNTVKSGVWYKYCIQQIDASKRRKAIKILKTPVMILPEDAFLISKDRQLKLKFNPSISSYKRMIKENMIDTLGSQFPFVRRNGNTNYAEFPISGLISLHMDDNNIFTSKEELAGKDFDLYETYAKEQGLFDKDRYLYEKMFRDKVIEFLYADDVKLFKSTTEGNFLVKVMNITFAPNPTLGRYIWTFSGNAVEIAECNVENCMKYGFLKGEK